MNCVPCITEFIPQTQRLTHVEIIDKICQITGCDVKHIKGKRRDGNIVETRHLICFILHSDRYLRLFLTQIGAILNRHHSTIIYAINHVKNLIEVDETYRIKVADIYQQVYGTTEYFNDFKHNFVEKQMKIKSISSAIKF